MMKTERDDDEDEEDDDNDSFFSVVLKRYVVRMFFCAASPSWKSPISNLVLKQSDWLFELNREFFSPSVATFLCDKNAAR